MNNTNYKINLNAQAFVPKGNTNYPPQNNKFQNYENNYNIQGQDNYNNQYDNYQENQGQDYNYNNQNKFQKNNFQNKNSYYQDNTTKIETKLVDYDEYQQNKNQNKKPKGNYNNNNYNNYDNIQKDNYNNYNDDYYNKNKNNNQYQKEIDYNQDYNNNSKKNQKGGNYKDNNYKDNYNNNYKDNNYNNNYKDNNYKDNYNNNYKDNYNNNYKDNNYKDNNYKDNNYKDNNYKDNYNKTNYKDNYSKTNYKDNYNKTNYKDNYSKTNYKDNYSKTNYKDNYEENLSQKFTKNANVSTYKENPIEKIETITKIVDKKTNKTKVIQQVTNTKSCFSQDLEDDYFDDETADLESGKFEENSEDNYEEDDYGNTYNHNNQEDEYEDSYDTYEKGANDFNGNNPIRKNELIFNDTECFTDYVDKLTSGEAKKHGKIYDNQVSVLMIAEKPSIARSISEALSSGRVNDGRRGKGSTVINFDGFFGDVKAKFTVSSVMGHVYTSDFEQKHNQWSSIDAYQLYDVPIVKLEANKKTRIPQTLQNLAKGKDIICLWLDCDKEGENICFEVINNCYKYLNKKNYQQIYRAKFSSLTKVDLKKAFNNMSERPNKFESLSVDVRQVIDLKIGVTFTRFLTSSILPGLKDEETKLLSYGPCQTPTLWFCVNRQKEIISFVPKEYFKVYTDIEIKKIKKRIYFQNSFWDRKSSNEFLRKFDDVRTAKVSDVKILQKSKASPCGMNTVQMLRLASSFLKISPHHTMVIAEKLYTMGYITYPRTETTKYAATFDFKKSLQDFSGHSTFGPLVNTHILKNYQRPTLKGTDVGDHPPITPARVAEQSTLKGDHWRLYSLICSNFFASLAPAMEYEERVNTITIENENFYAESINITKEGFLSFMPWKRGNYIKSFPIVARDDPVVVSLVSYDVRWTEPPGFLTESDLLKLMEKNKIGTDASMPVHIENICNRGYVEVDEGRKLIPTPLGKSLIESLSIVDPELVLPTCRAEIEEMVHSVAIGKKSFSEILKYSLNLYKQKFIKLRQNYEKMLMQFRRHFTVDVSGITNISKNIKKQNLEHRAQNQVKKTEQEIRDSIIKQCCLECKGGKMYIDYDAIDKFIMRCINYAVKIDLDQVNCPHCSALLCEVEIQFPLITGEKKLAGCLFCDERINYGL